MKLTTKQYRVIELMIGYLEIESKGQPLDDLGDTKAIRIGGEWTSLSYTLKWFKEIHSKNDDTKAAKDRLNSMRVYYLKQLIKDM